MRSGLNYRTLCLVAPSGDCLRGYKPRAVDCSCLAPRVAASCLAKPSCYTLLYLACVLVLVLSCVAARLSYLCLLYYCAFVQVDECIEYLFIKSGQRQLSLSSFRGR